MTERNNSLQNNSAAKNGHCIQEATFGEWKFRYSKHEEIFSKKAVSDALVAINSWEEHFPQEDTWIRTHHRIPSLIIRLDATIVDGQLAIYEIEERPSGIGLTGLTNGDFGERLAAIRATWPDFKVVTSPDPRRRGSDDHLWTNSAEKDTEELVLVRAEPEEEEFHRLEPQSISSLKKKGDKSYGERVGMWSPVVHPDELTWEEPFVLKPRQGSKTRDVFIWLPPDVSRDYRIGSSVPGAHTKTKIANAVQASEPMGGMYKQQFYPPIERGISDENRWMIYRVFFGFDLGNLSWNCLGGAWVARPNLKIHGATDGLSGPVIVEV